MILLDRKGKLEVFGRGIAFSLEGNRDKNKRPHCIKRKTNKIRRGEVGNPKGDEGNPKDCVATVVYAGYARKWERDFTENKENRDGSAEENIYANQETPYGRN